ncbi:MAG: isoleucyl-tRNA synthetase [Pedobacter sp.]|nr:MAG: isoleucyl-tRNA synthetase [Pedobacter sp.]
MIKALKLRKAVVAIAIGILALVVAQIMTAYNVDGNRVVLGVSGVCLIIGAILFLYPILFAKKVDKDGDEVELKPVEKDGLGG